MASYVTFSQRQRASTGHRGARANCTARSVAPGGVDPPTVVAHTAGDVRRRRRVVGHRRVVGGTRNLGRNSVSDVCAATHLDPSAAADAYVGTGDTGWLH